MVLLDSNIIIDLWKNPSEAVKYLLKTDEVCICGVVRSELMHGAYSEKNLAEISAKLDLLEELNLEENQWDGLGRLLYKLRINGVTLPFADAMIAYIALINEVGLLTNDKHFLYIKRIIPELKLI